MVPGNEIWGGLLGGNQPLPDGKICPWPGKEYGPIQAGTIMVMLSGGNKLEEFLKDLGKKVTQSATVEVGFMEDATYEDGTPVALVAMIQDYGAPAVNIPPRSFFRNMIAEESEHWGEDLAVLLKTTNYNAEQALDLMGEEIAGELQDSINEFDSVPLAPATIASKGFDKQLIDTAHMFRSVSHRVIK